MRNFLVPISILMIGIPAQANEPDIRDLIECVPAKEMTKLSDAVTGMKATRVDTINTNPSFELNALDGGPLPDRMFHRAQDGTETDLKMSETGKVEGFAEIFAGDKKAEMCVEDSARAGLLKTDDAFSFNMSLNMNFINKSGVYSMAELKDGLSDGKAVIKKMVDSPAAIFVPDMSHLYVEFEDPEAQPAFTAVLEDGKEETVETVKLGEAFMIDYDSLKDMNAQTLRIEGGAHTLSPSMSPERMAKVTQAEEKSDAK